MTAYRLFKLNEDGHIVGVCECAYDGDAQLLGAAMDLLASEDGRVAAVEAWRGATMLVTLARF
jgi:hypothetical protein